MQRFGGNSGRVLMIAVLPASIIAAMFVFRAQPAPGELITTTPTISATVEESTSMPTVLPDTATPTVSPTAVEPTATPVPYSIAAVEAQGGLGISNLYIIDAPLQQQAI